MTHSSSATRPSRGRWLALAGLMAGCASEKAKVNVPFKLVSSSGKALEKIQVTFLSKDGKYAEMSQSQDGGIGSVMLFPEEYDVGVNKYEGGKSMQAMKAGTPEYEEAMAKYGGSIPPKNVLPSILEDPRKSGLSLTAKGNIQDPIEFKLPGVE